MQHRFIAIHEEIWESTWNHDLQTFGCMWAYREGKHKIITASSLWLDISYYVLIFTGHSKSSFWFSEHQDEALTLHEATSEMVNISCIAKIMPHHCLFVFSHCHWGQVCTISLKCLTPTGSWRYHSAIIIKWKKYSAAALGFSHVRSVILLSILFRKKTVFSK